MKEIAPIRVFIVDDHLLVLQGLNLLLKDENAISICGTSQSGEEALEKLKKLDCEVVLMDINLPGINGIETCKKLKEQYPNIAVIGLSMNTEVSLMKLMLKHGASGYLLKNADKNELLKAIRTVHAGDRYLSDDSIDLLSGQAKGGNESALPPLSRREKEVLQLIVNEHTTQEIADKLFISFATVETHRHNLLLKLSARNTAGLVRMAVEYGLLDK
jgi:DNA-binding NarL/FixJ family response regulator